MERGCVRACVRACVCVCVCVLFDIVVSEHSWESSANIVGS